MRLYRHVLDMGGAAVEALEKVLSCTIEEAFATYCGREGLWTPSVPGAKLLPAGNLAGAPK
jgi:hypothetical protein